MLSKLLTHQFNTEKNKNTESKFKAENLKVYNVPKNQFTYYHPTQHYTVLSKNCFKKTIVAEQNKILLNTATPKELAKKSTEDIKNYITQQRKKINDLYSFEQGKYMIQDKEVNQNHSKYHNDALVYLKNTLNKALYIQSTKRSIASKICNQIEKYIMLKTKEEKNTLVNIQ